MSAKTMLKREGPNTALNNDRAAAPHDLDGATSVRCCVVLGRLFSFPG